MRPEGPGRSDSDPVATLWRFCSLPRPEEGSLVHLGYSFSLYPCQLTRLRIAHPGFITSLLGGCCTIAGIIGSALGGCQSLGGLSWEADNSYLALITNSAPFLSRSHVWSISPSRLLLLGFPCLFEAGESAPMECIHSSTHCLVSSVRGRSFSASSISS